MRCHHSEDDLALYVEGDLGEARQREIAAHLEECGACCAFVAELRESQAVFKCLRGEMVSAAALSDVRNRVLAGVAVSRGRMPWGRWLYAVAGLACVVVAVVVFTPPRRGGVAAPVIKSREATETAQTGWSDRPKHSAEPTTPALRATPPFQGGEKAKQQVVVKLLTDDPDIVIYWLIDENGG
jgi:anti-sigma factor RsiW